MSQDLHQLDIQILLDVPAEACSVLVALAIFVRVAGNFLCLSISNNTLHYDITQQVWWSLKLLDQLFRETTELLNLCI